MTKKDEFRQKQENFEALYGFKAKNLHNFVKLTCFKPILRCKECFLCVLFEFVNV